MKIKVMPARQVVGDGHIVQRHLSQIQQATTAQVGIMKFPFTFSLIPADSRIVDRRSTHG